MRASNKVDSQRTTTPTDNKKRDYENEGSSMHDGSCIGINYAHRFPKCSRSLSHIVELFALYFVSSIQFVAVPIYSISDLYANSLYNFTLRKRSCEVLSLHLPSVTVDVSCKRSNCNEVRKIVKVARLTFYPKTANNGSHRSIMSLCTSDQVRTFI